MSNITNRIKLYENNKDKPWREWLKVDTIFKKQGKQGVVGVMTSLENENISYVFKVSQWIDYLIHHELIVMRSLNTISDYCHNFCRSIGNIICEIDTGKKKGDPFDIKTKYPVEKEVLLMENIKNAVQFRDIIDDEDIEENVLYSLVKQVLLAISVAQKKVNFTHYDLHSNNIMVKKCDPDVVFLYVIDENTQFCIPSYGMYPIIIDFGFSYSSSVESNYFHASFSHTDVGFYSDRFDPIADPKLFLITVADEIHQERQTKRSNVLYNMSKNLFSTLSLDWQSGWDNYSKKCATDYVIAMLKPYNTSLVFSGYEYYFMDMLFSMVEIPLKEHKYDNVDVSFSTFIAEYGKIENSISDPFHCLYILKYIIEGAKTVKDDYQNKTTRSKALEYFRISIYERLDSIAKFCRPKNLNFEKLLCSLLCLGKCIQGILFDTMEYLWSRREKRYSKLPLKNINQIYTAVEINIKDTYKFNENTTIKVFDCMAEETSFFSLDENETQEINSYTTITKGSELYKLFISKYK